MSKIYVDDCNHPHNAYLGSFDRSDFYLYRGVENTIAICKRMGREGNYETINYKYDKKKFMQTLTEIGVLNPPREVNI